ncbi:chorismate lyase [Acidovorax sp. SUPP3334]|uniref:chorismate--pyruvate lyase family protein n=1 Tax=Acidovorax sp. SUPP3334 TaxID=2920881 RepID=UPI0023DE3C87|nr:chorismate lyase [Acidovorax sp. SUPP3334]GKT22466.1 chorismate lyase [Acidovorax sp. SUPP3334]
MNEKMLSAKFSTNWVSFPLQAFPEDKLTWLFAPGSLTLKVKALGDYSLEVVDQRVAPADHFDAHALRLAAGSPVWTREVLMRINGVPCIAARSVTGIHALQGPWAELADYGQRPLGDLLHQHRLGPDAVTRMPFECAELSPGDPLSLLSRRFDTDSESLFARRSAFVRRQTPLLVSECFLQGFWRTVALLPSSTLQDSAETGPI